MSATDLEEVEQRLRAAIADDIELNYSGDAGNVIVLEYVIVATVLDHEGHEDVRYTYSQNVQYVKVLGWLDYLQTVVRDRLIQARRRKS
jgi:hypothetical protein